MEKNKGQANKKCVHVFMPYDPDVLSTIAAFVDPVPPTRMVSQCSSSPARRECQGLCHLGTAIIFYQRALASLPSSLVFSRSPNLSLNPRTVAQSLRAHLLAGCSVCPDLYIFP